MKIDMNDPQLTAYALGELHGQEAEDMKNRIDNDPEAKKFVEDIQATAKILSKELAKEPLERLAPEKRAELLRAEPRSWFQKPQWIAGLSTLATASLALVVGLKVYQANPPGPLGMPGSNMQVRTSENSTDSEIENPYIFEAQTKEVAEPTAAPESLEDAYKFSEAPAAVPAGNSLGTTDSSPQGKMAIRPKKFTSLKRGGATNGGETASMDKDVSKVGLLSAFGGGTMGKRLEQGYGGSGELLGVGQNSVGDASVNTESYSFYEENSIMKVTDEPLSTFSIDVDTASYSNVRRMLIDSQWPTKDAVRLEEMVNYFRYDYAPPTDGKPFATHVEIAQNPWNQKSRLVRIALKGKEIAAENRPAANLVFLVDASGSMMEERKLPLVKKAMNLLVDKMRPQDHVAIVVYAGSSGLVLDSTNGNQKEKIRHAIDAMTAGGSTNGGAGIELAYTVAAKNFVKGGINRVIMATDGDFNVGITNEGDLIRLIEEKAKTGVYLSVLGFGMGNLKDSNMQKLSNKGNGNYAYIDSLREARKALVEQSGGTLMTIAKDVKIQVEFNPKFVTEYRLVGYEKRKLNAEDFNDDTKDAGEIGSGHTVTAFYEVYTTDNNGKPKADPLKYQDSTETKSNNSTELLTVKLRYKMPEGDKSELIEIPVQNSDKKFEEASSDFKFAASVAEFAQVMKDSKFKGSGNLNHVLEVSTSNTKVNDRENSYRKEFVELVKKARSLQK